MKDFPEQLVARGWEVHVVSSPGAQLTELGEAGVVTVHAIPMRRDVSPLRDLRSLWRWFQLLRKVQPAAVMVGTPKAGLLGIVTAAALRVPVRIYHVRGLRLETTRGLRRAVLSTLERLTFRTSTSALAVSDSLRTAVVAAGLTPPDRVVLLGRGSSNGVDTQRFRPVRPIDDLTSLKAKLGLAPGVPVIGFVGRLHRDKGADVLAQASCLLTVRDVKHQLLIVGGTEDVSSEQVLRSVTDNGTPSVFTGAVHDPSPYYHLMDVLCLPTFREGFPNVVLEAAASGIPVVTTDATGAVDSIVPDVTGLLARTGDSESLAGCLEQLLHDSELCALMGRRAREHAVEHYERLKVWDLIADYLNDQGIPPAG